MNVRKNKRIKISQLQNRQTQKEALFQIIEDTLERNEHRATKINHDMKSAVDLRRNEKKVPSYHYHVTTHAPSRQQGPVAQSTVSANHWLRSIEKHTFLG